MLHKIIVSLFLVFMGTTPVVFATGSIEFENGTKWTIHGDFKVLYQDIVEKRGIFIEKKWLSMKEQKAQKE